MTPSFSIVIPTFRRSRLLRAVLPSYVATEAEEILLVDDGSGPPYDAALEELAGERVHLLRLPHLGLPAARQAGAGAATGEWVVFGEDDCWFPPDYPSVLIEHAVGAGASACSGSARLVHPDLLGADPTSIAAAIDATGGFGRHPPDRLLGTAWPVERLANGDLVTPLLTAVAAVHRSVFERVRFDPEFRGNAFREETDFFLTCHERGMRCVRCVHAACAHLKVGARSGGGGAWTMGRARYGGQMLANNWRFVRKHRDSLVGARREAGRRGGAVRMQLEFTWDLLRRSLGPEDAPAPSSSGGSPGAARAAGRSSTSRPRGGSGPSR